MKNKTYKWQRVTENGRTFWKIVSLSLLMAMSACGSKVQYLAYQTANDSGATVKVYCPDANSIDNPTDGVLADLVIPQTPDAIRFCEGD